MKRTIVTTLLLVALLGLVASAATGQVVRQRDPAVTPQGSIDGTFPLDGEASGDARVLLARSPRGLHLRGTVHVTPGNTYTVWWIVLGAEVVVVNATGGVATPTGEFHFGAGLPIGPHTTGVRVPEVVFLGGTVTADDAMTAPVLLHILDHGPPTPGIVRKQIVDIFTGPPGQCDPVAGCPLSVEIFFDAP